MPEKTKWWAEHEGCRILLFFGLVYILDEIFMLTRFEKSGPYSLDFVPHQVLGPFKPQNLPKLHIIAHFCIMFILVILMSIVKLFFNQVKIL